MPTMRIYSSPTDKRIEPYRFVNCTDSCPEGWFTLNETKQNEALQKQSPAPSRCLAEGPRLSLAFVSFRSAALRFFFRLFSVNQP